MDNKKADFVNIYIKSGNEFYEKSKGPQEGFKEFTLKTGGKTYHKIHESISGKLMKVVKKESEYGDTVDLFLSQSEDLVYVLSLKIWNVSKSLDSWVLEILKYLPSMQIGKEYKISTNKTSKNDGGYLYTNLYVNEIVDGELVKLDWVLYDDMPKGKKSVATGKYNFSERDDFAYIKLMESIDSIKKNTIKEHTKDYPSKDPVVITSKPKAEPLPF